jgi:argininosuccinate synthase
MKSPVVLAYAGGIHASAALPWLADTFGVEVVTVTLDVGQGRELGELRARALSCGAVRAHVIDARDEFARDVLFASLTARAGDAPSHTALPWPLIAWKVVEVARIEGADTVAHGAIDPAFDALIHAMDPSMTILAPARVWTMSADDLAVYARARRLPVQTPVGGGWVDQHLWGRQLAWDGEDMPAAAQPRVPKHGLNAPAFVDLHFERRIPTSVNGVAMSPAELIESLSLIGSQHGIGRTVSSQGSHHVLHEAAAATILRAAAAVAGESLSADVCLRLADGQYTVVKSADRQSVLVNHA